MSTESVFHCAIRTEYRDWQALQAAIEHGMGGPDAREKELWMADVTENYFMENRNLSQDEVEDFIATVLNNEFDTIAEDGSVEKISEKFCRFYSWCEIGQGDKILQSMEAAQASKTARQQPVTEVAQQLSYLTLNSEESGKEKSADAEWTVVSKKKK